MKNGILILLVFSCPAICLAQKPSSITTIKQLTDSIAAIAKEENITGLMLGITTKDSVLFSGGFGYSDLEAKGKADKGSLFRMGSITKMFVSLGIMKLVSDGKLRLDDELKKIAPEVPFKNRWENTHPVRIVHLLEHTSGFDDIKLDRMYSLDTIENKGIEMMLVHKPSMKCRWKPGERFSYSNPNYAILGYIIEKITGKSYDAYLTENILAPLGMYNSNFNLRSKFPGRDVKEYVIKNGLAQKVKSVTLLSGPQGALWSSAEDMVTFLQLFLRNGDPLFSANTIAEIETCHSSLAARSGQTNGYSLGSDNTFFGYSKAPFRGHEGITGTCLSSCKYNRELGIGYVIASNSYSNNYRIEELIVSYFERNLPDRQITGQSLDKNAIQSFLGRYQFESPRNAISAFSDKLQNAPRVYLQNDRLFIKPLIGPPAELLQTGHLTFAFQGMNMSLVRFTKNDEGANVMMIAGIYYEQAGNLGALLKRGIVVVALLFVLSSILLGIGSVIGTLMGRLAWRAMIPRVIPMIALILLIIAVMNLLEVQKYTYLLAELDTINSRTLTIFLGTSAFGIASIISLVSAIAGFRKQEMRWFRWYVLLLSISFVFISGILLQNGWLGLRTWAL